MCVIFLTHIGDRHDAVVLLRFVVEKSVLGFVFLSPPLCDNRRSITAAVGARALARVPAI